MAMSRALRQILEKIKTAANLTDAELNELKKALAGSDSGAPRTQSGTLNAQQTERELKFLDDRQRKLQAAAELERELAILRDESLTKSRIDRDYLLNLQKADLKAEQELLEIMKAQEDLDVEAIANQAKKIEQKKQEIVLQEKQNNLLKEAENMGADMADKFAGLFGISGGGFAGMMADAGDAGGAFKMLGSISQGVGAQLAKSFNPTVILGSLFAKAVETFGAIDQLNEELYTDTGIENLGFKVSEFSQDMKLLENASVEMADTMRAMQTEFQGFYDLSDESQGNIAKTSALMVKMGIDARTTAQSTGFLVTSLGMTGAQAEETNREMVTLAHSLSLPPSQVMESFNAASKSLSKYGDGMTIEFKRMQAASKTLNMDVGSLIDTMAGMDTFEGAANMAGDLNAMLGGPYLNSIELLGQSESERLVTLSKTLDAQGMSFDQMSKFQKMGIAKTLGMDVDELGKLMNKAPEELAAAMAEADKEAKSREAMAKQVEDAMGIMAQLAMEVRDVFKALFEDIFGKGNSLVGFKSLLSAMLEPIRAIAKLVRVVNGVFDDFFSLIGLGDSNIKSLVKTFGVLAATLGTLKFGFGAVAKGAAKMVSALAPGVGGAAGREAGKAAGKAGPGALKVGVKAFKTATGRGKGLFGGLKSAYMGMTKGGVVKQIGRLFKGGPMKILGRLGSAMKSIPFLGSMIEALFAYGDIKDLIGQVKSGDKKPEDVYGPIGTRVFQGIAGVGGGSAAAILSNLIPGIGTLLSPIAFMAGDALGKYVVDAMKDILPTAPLGEMVYNMFGPGNPESAAAAMPTPAAPTPVNDFVVYRPSASDEMVGIKEGGILAKKLDRIADLFNSNDKDWRINGYRDGWKESWTGGS